MKKIIVAVDSFKACLTSIEVAKAVEEGIKTVFPLCEVIKFPIADGGEGILNALMSACGGEYVSLQVHDPLMCPIEARYGVSPDGKTGLIEMAVSSGLTLLPEEKRNPMVTTTYGFGESIRDALERGCRNFIVGIGGSATNDAGLGMLQALGFRFLDKRKNVLGTGGRMMIDVASIDDSFVHPGLKEASFLIACDVWNPFCGPEGAAHVFARQKGATGRMIEELDAGMQSLAQIIYQTTGKNIASVPGTGAAGGVGGAFYSFLNAELKSGIQLLLDFLDFESKLDGVDLIITGEGRVDKQTVMGKAPYGILKIAEKKKIPVIMIAGHLEDVPEINQAGFEIAFSISPGPVSLEKAMDSDFARENIKRLLVQIGRVYNIASESCYLKNKLE
jgi:glycerate kinase